MDKVFIFKCFFLLNCVGLYGKINLLLFLITMPSTPHLNSSKEVCIVLSADLANRTCLFPDGYFYFFKEAL